MTGSILSLRTLVAGLVWLAVILASRALGASWLAVFVLMVIVGLATGLAFRRLGRDQLLS